MVAKSKAKAKDSSRSGTSYAQVAQEVLNGKWGANPERADRLSAEGYDPGAVQTEVNRRLGGGAPSAYRDDVATVALQVTRGQWGEDAECRRRLEGAGYNLFEVQAEIDKRA